MYLLFKGVVKGGTESFTGFLTMKFTKFTRSIYGFNIQGSAPTRTDSLFHSAGIRKPMWPRLFVSVFSTLNTFFLSHLCPCLSFWPPRSSFTHKNTLVVLRPWGKMKRAASANGNKKKERKKAQSGLNGGWRLFGTKWWIALTFNKLLGEASARISYNRTLYTLLHYISPLFPLFAPLPPFHFPLNAPYRGLSVEGRSIRF